MKPTVFNLSCVFALIVLSLVLIGMVIITTVKFSNMLGTTKAETTSEGTSSAMALGTLTPPLPMSDTEFENAKPIFFERCRGCHDVQRL
ncbi:MAG TPA: hypothetical protein ENI48_12020 [Thioploca sp.]|nr:hypothetical protein [Thioploca sp.]